MSALNDQQFFHGTKHDIKGDTLKPSSWTGKPNYDYDARMFPTDHEERRDSVFMTNRETGAWRWTSGPARPRVHVVEPEGTVKDDVAGGKGMAFMANGPARIKDTIWIKPPDKTNEPVQGTLPPQDWRHFAPHLGHEANNTPLGVHNKERQVQTKTTADWMVQGDENEARVRQQLAKRNHPTLFNPEQF